jgi:hypothetical protein
MSDNMKHVGVVLFAIALMAGVVRLVTLEHPNICERSERARAELLACQGLPNCRATLQDLHRALNLHNRCEKSK